MTNAAAPGSSVHERTENIQHSLSNGNLVNAESNGVGDVNPRIPVNVDKVRSWEYSDISDSAQLNALKLPDPQTASKVMRLMYANRGLGLLALASNASHKLWKWKKNEQNTSAESSSALSIPQFWQPDNGVHMTNDLSGPRPTEESPACFAITKNENYLISASGGKFSLFFMMDFKMIAKFLPSPPAATYVALDPYDNNVFVVGMEDSSISIYHYMVDEMIAKFPPSPPAATYVAMHPYDNNVFAVGMEDSSILVYHYRVDEVEIMLEGHQKRITGLAFSTTLGVLVSSGADAQVCVWDMAVWEKIRTKSIQAPPGHTLPLVGETSVQFNSDQDHLLVVHESQIAVYDAQLECLRSWYPREALSSAIMTGTYSCDGSLVFVGFANGAVGIFDSNSLRLRCRIAPSAYISSSISSRSSSAYPVVVAAHPRDPTQFALGMSDGAVYVIEPLTTERWHDSENGSYLLNG